MFRRLGKKIGLAALCLVMLLPVLPVSAAEKELTKQEIQLRLNEITSNYALYEPLSEDDANFVKKYAMVAPTPAKGGFTTQSTKSVNFYGYPGPNAPDRMSGLEVQGSISVDIGIINNSISVNMGIQDIENKYWPKLSNEVHMTAFGLLGSGGTYVGIVADFTLSNSKENATYCTYVGSKNFMASVAYYSVDAKSIVEYEGLRYEIPGVVF